MHRYTTFVNVLKLESFFVAFLSMLSSLFPWSSTNFFHAIFSSGYIKYTNFAFLLKVVYREAILLVCTSPPPPRPLNKITFIMTACLLSAVLKTSKHLKLQRFNFEKHFSSIASKPITIRWIRTSSQPDWN